MTPTQKSDTYGNFFCNNKGNRLHNVMWDLAYSKTNDPLYVQVYNSRKNTVESLSLTVILHDLMFNYLYPFPDKSVNSCNQINLYEFYFVSSSIYYLIQEFWNEISTNGFYNMEGAYTNPRVNEKVSLENGSYVRECNMEEAYTNPRVNNNIVLENGFYVGEWNMEKAYTNPCVNVY